jgi:hypothetical protein
MCLRITFCNHQQPGRASLVRITYVHFIPKSIFKCLVRGKSLIIHTCKVILTWFRPVPMQKHKGRPQKTYCHPYPVVKMFYVVLWPVPNILSCLPILFFLYNVLS